ncbi:5'-methylthioadenosine/S-adenosylhomocysteine nucleosidase [Leptolyngbya sp. FACHB-261]|uniref:5'-methylthioadenosine/S-adenosylhomocysteine nucleosidase family protein n=1 Tax=Leptolyngbya sp. FACHB-261 TaxID=2692806 RepID=UPI0016825E1E|nr:5'-methylthioadenosine/S-adenosylhomocysteine nucleosidase [Leptolyngbya sp. FACHB-261]MBD2100980.1 5'-methylthioadenosine/S-adenosylhomocysteine nucleosidase [Leptolyngbya sp. FACHB-261]
MPSAVILTALSVEYSAVRTHLTDLQEKMHPQGTIYERGKFVANGQVWEVGIAEVGAGNAGAAVEAERAIAYFRPDVLLFVGIAGGIKDVAIGDVVAATKVYGYESGKVDNQFFTRPALGQSAYALVQRAKSEARKGEWLQRLSSSLTSRPHVFVAPIAAGEKVISSKQSDVFKFIRASYNDAIAVEMESFGFLSAVFAYPDIKALVIRGISDLIDGKNDDSVESEQVRQEKASHHASAFTFEVLAKFSLDNRSESMTALETQEFLRTDKSRPLENIEQKRYKLSQLDQHLEPYISPTLKEVLDWLSTSRSSLAQRIVNDAFEDCPNLKRVVKSNKSLENRINWEFEKYLENIQNSLLTKHRKLLDQPPIYSFLKKEGSLFTLEERRTFKPEEGRFYTLALQNLKDAVPKRYSEDIKLEMIDYIHNLRNNLPR